MKKDFRQRITTVPRAEGGVDYVDGNTEETVEGLVAPLQGKEPGELYMYARVRGNREHGLAGIRKEHLKELR